MSSVEHIGLVGLIALVFGAFALASTLQPADEGARILAGAIERKIRCGAVGPGPCWRDDLTVAYGRDVGGAIRALAPSPEPVAGALPVDFRYCRQVSCAAGPPGARLTASNRRTTVFTEIRRTPIGPAVAYWLYRPGQPWQEIVVELDPGTVSAHRKTPLLESDIPALVPLETLDGRNHIAFSSLEEPPWRWRIESNHAIR